MYHLPQPETCSEKVSSITRAHLCRRCSLRAAAAESGREAAAKEGSEHGPLLRKAPPEILQSEAEVPAKVQMFSLCFLHHMCAVNLCR